MNDTNNDYYLYQGKIYHCSECTTEGELVGHYGGDCYLFLDELGNYVLANDCVKVESPNFWQHFKFWVFENVWLNLIGFKNELFDFLTGKRCDVYSDYDSADSDNAYMPFDDCEF